MKKWVKEIIHGQRVNETNQFEVAIQVNDRR